jgi:hypothetical protein
MPGRINQDKMIECLLKIHNALSIIWLECRNDTLSDALMSQMNYIQLLINTIES